MMWMLDVAFWSLVLIILLPAVVVGLSVPWTSDAHKWTDE